MFKRTITRENGTKSINVFKTYEEAVESVGTSMGLCESIETIEIGEEGCVPCPRNVYRARNVDIARFEAYIYSTEFKCDENVTLFRFLSGMFYSIDVVADSKDEAAEKIYRVMHLLDKGRCKEGFEFRARVSEELKEKLEKADEGLSVGFVANHVYDVKSKCGYMVRDTFGHIPKFFSEEHDAIRYMIEECCRHGRQYGHISMVSKDIPKQQMYSLMLLIGEDGFRLTRHDNADTTNRYVMYTFRNGGPELIQFPAESIEKAMDIAKSIMSIMEKAED